MTHTASPAADAALDAALAAAEVIAAAELALALSEADDEGAVEALPDGEYALAQRVLDAMAWSPRTGAAYPPSMIARWVGATTDEVRRVLPALAADGNLRTEGNRAWTNYRFICG